MIFALLFILLGLGCWVLFTALFFKFAGMDPTDAFDLAMAVGLGFLCSLIWPLVLIALGVGYGAIQLGKRLD